MTGPARTRPDHPNALAETAGPNPSDPKNHTAPNPPEQVRPDPTDTQITPRRNRLTGPSRTRPDHSNALAETASPNPTDPKNHTAPKPPEQLQPDPTDTQITPRRNRLTGPARTRPDHSNALAETTSPNLTDPKNAPRRNPPGQVRPDPPDTQITPRRNRLTGPARTRPDHSNALAKTAKPNPTDHQITSRRTLLGRSNQHRPTPKSPLAGTAGASPTGPARHPNHPSPEPLDRTCPNPPGPLKRTRQNRQPEPDRPSNHTASNPPGKVQPTSTNSKITPRRNRRSRSDRIRPTPKSPLDGTA